MTQKEFPGATQPEYQLTDALDIDYYEAFGNLTDADREVWKRARDYAESVAEELNANWNEHVYDTKFAKGLGERNLLGDGLDHPDIEHFSPLATGLVNMELARVDGSLGTVLAVQGGLALRTLVMHGTQEQKDKYLKALYTLETPGAFGLTEPDHGSDSAGLETVATRQEDGSWVLRGSKRWIGNGAAGGVTFIFARINDEGAEDHGTVGGFIVPQDTPGYTGTPIRYKGALRGIDQADIFLDDVAIPDSNRLPGVKKFRDVSAILYATRSGVAWSALGHATACFEAALSYAKQRKQFGKYLGEHQLVQEKLTSMLADLTSMQLFCVQLAELEAAGKLRPTQASLAKYNNTRLARNIARVARDMLGGNGIKLENRVIVHMADIEALHTYEGTESVQALLIGRDMTGFQAFA